MDYNDYMKIESPIGRSDLINKNELSSVINVISSIQPRKEYVSGSIKLDFKGVLPTGEFMEAVEDDAGIASIVLKKEGETILDFAKFLPYGVKFVTPTYIERYFGSKAKYLGQWTYYPDHHLLSIGDIRNVYEIFALLHEIGHTHQTRKWQTDILKKLPLSENDEKIKVRFLSSEERDAWSRAIRIARQIKESAGVNLFETFNTKEEFQEFLYSTLLSHKLGGNDTLSSGVVKSLWEKILYMIGLESKREKQNNIFLSGLFDKGRLSRAMEAEKIKQKEEGEEPKA